MNQNELCPEGHETVMGQCIPIVVTFADWAETCGLWGSETLKMIDIGPQRLDEYMTYEEFTNRCNRIHRRYNILNKPLIEILKPYQEEFNRKMARYL